MSSCLISPAQVLSDMQPHVLIDVRRPAERAGVWIPDALNLDLRDIGSSPFIPADKTSIVLLGEMRDMPRMLRACQSAATSKTRAVRVLAGGLKAWRDAGGSLLGEALQLDSDRVIAPSVLREFASLPGVWLLNETDIPPSGAATWMDVSGQLPDTVVSGLRKTIDENPPLAVLVLLDPSLGQGRRALWKNALRAAGLSHPIFYVDGVQAYSAWVERQSGMRAWRSRSLDTGCRWN